MPGDGVLGTTGWDNPEKVLCLAYLAAGNFTMAEGHSWNVERWGTRSVNPEPVKQMMATSLRISLLSTRGEYEDAYALAEALLIKDREIPGRNNNPQLTYELGRLQLRMGNLAQAEKTLLRTYAEIARETDVDELKANIFFSLCEIEFLKGNGDRGVIGLRKARDIYEQEFAKLAQFGSDSQKLAFLQNHRSKADFVLGIHFDRLPNHAGLAQEAFALVQQRKDRMTALARMAPKDPTHAASKKLSLARSKLGLLSLGLGIVDRGSADPSDLSRGAAAGRRGGDGSALQIGSKPPRS